MSENKFQELMISFRWDLLTSHRVYLDVQEVELKCKYNFDHGEALYW